MILFKEIERRKKEKVNGKRAKPNGKSRQVVDWSRGLKRSRSSISYDNLRKGEKKGRG